MRLMLPKAAALLAVGLATTPATAAEQALDFTQGNFCNGGELCTNNAVIDQNHGSTAEVLVTYVSVYDNLTTGPMYYYERGFGDLNGVAYANKGSADSLTRGRIILGAREGYEISLKSFDLGCFNNLINCREAVYRVRPGVGDYQTGTVGTGYPGHRTVEFNGGYGDAVDIFFGAGENVGIDNIRWDVRRIGAAAVPEPASWAMMIGGFGAVGTGMRRRARRPLALA